ncbi:hypothetical protein ElyMa_002847100 [Elysia marginata]|uniref:Uncharacterized protein n=1 Tax=Elysia marginata TaxID=1093978 RepID=A0AAV4HZ97_9GAST|nr:hypothetical protein ElyMa_002847100 [Elysia marginata]
MVVISTVDDNDGGDGDDDEENDDNDSGDGDDDEENDDNDGGDEVPQHRVPAVSRQGPPSIQRSPPPISFTSPKFPEDALSGSSPPPIQSLSIQRVSMTGTSYTAQRRITKADTHTENVEPRRVGNSRTATYDKAAKMPHAHII